MVLCKRRKTCLVAGPAFPAIPEDSQLESRRDSVESSGSSAAWPASSSRCSMAPAISFHRAKRSFGCGVATDFATAGLCRGRRGWRACSLWCASVTTTSSWRHWAPGRSAPIWCCALVPTFPSNRYTIQSILHSEAAFIRTFKTFKTPRRSWTSNGGSATRRLLGPNPSRATPRR